MIWYAAVRKGSTATAGALPPAARTGKLAQLSKGSSAFWIEALVPISGAMQVTPVHE